MTKKKSETEGRFKVTDLVMYSNRLPYPMPHITVGLIIERMNIRQCIQDLIDNHDSNPYINDGFLKEWESYNKLREDLQIPTSNSDYLAEREYMLDRIMEQDQDFKYLYKVLWNNGEQYIEHPEDLTLFELEEED